MSPALLVGCLTKLYTLYGNEQGRGGFPNVQAKRAGTKSADVLYNLFSDPLPRNTHQMAPIPPSSASAWPVMKELAGSARNRMPAMISSPSATRFIGTPRVNSASASASGAPAERTKLSTIAVLVWAGQTALMRRPLLAYSAAADFVSPTTPCLAAA